MVGSPHSGDPCRLSETEPGPNRSCTEHQLNAVEPTGSLQRNTVYCSVCCYDPKPTTYTTWIQYNEFKRVDAVVFMSDFAVFHLYLHELTSPCNYMSLQVATHTPKDGISSYSRWLLCACLHYHMKTNFLHFTHSYTKCRITLPWLPNVSTNSKWWPRWLKSQDSPLWQVSSALRGRSMWPKYWLTEDTFSTCQYQHFKGKHQKSCSSSVLQQIGLKRTLQLFY